MTYSSATTSFTKFFAQPDFGYRRNHFAIAFSSKISFVNFAVRSSTLSQDHYPDDYNDIESFKKGKSYVWWEPGILIRGGFKNLQAFTQVTYSIHDEALPYCNKTFSVGIIAPFNIKSNKTK